MPRPDRSSCMPSNASAPPRADVLPDMLRPTPDYIVRGYGHDDRIVYGTGAVVADAQICGRGA